MRSIGRITQFFRQGLWEADLATARGGRGAALAALRVAAHALRSFASDLGSLRASGLTLVTLLALVPLLALATGVAKGLGYADVLDAELLGWTDRVPEGMRPAIEEVRALVQRTSFGAIGAIGSALLTYSGLLLFVRVEQALNRVWQVPRGRRWHRRVTAFVALVVLVPLLVLAAVSLDSLLHGASWLQGVPWLDSLYRAGLGFVPDVLAWMALTALYKLMPAAPVRWSAAAIGGAVAAVAWLAVHGLYLYTQLSVARANAIYATLAALPLLLVYLQVTWTIVLVGADVSYAFQNRHRLRGPVAVPRPSQSMRRRLALLLASRVAAAFAAGERGDDLGGHAARLGVPLEWVAGVYDDLAAAGLLGRLDDASGRVVPLLPPRCLGVLDVVRAVDGEVPAALRPQLELSADLEDRLARLEAAERAILADESMGT